MKEWCETTQNTYTNKDLLKDGVLNNTKVSSSVCDSTQIKARFGIERLKTYNFPSKDNNEVLSPNLSTDILSPHVVEALQEEIKRNSRQLSEIYLQNGSDNEHLVLKDGLIDERKYLLNQMSNHLDAVIQQAKKVEIIETDMDQTCKDVTTLKSKVDKLALQCDTLDSRKLLKNPSQ